MKKLAIFILIYIPLFGCAVQRYHFATDPHVVSTPVPQSGQIWYCEHKAWGGDRCDAWDPYELKAWASTHDVSLVCVTEKGFTETCWRAEDMDDHGRYSY